MPLAPLDVEPVFEPTALVDAVRVRPEADTVDFAGRAAGAAVVLRIVAGRSLLISVGRRTPADAKREAAAAAS